MKKFADLHLQPDLDDMELIEEIIQKASDLNYSLVGVALPPRVKQDTTHFLRKTCRTHNVDFATRIDLIPNTPSELLKDLRQFRRRLELVSVKCLSKSVARQAAKDHRVDLLNFPSGNPRERFFDDAEARLASQGEHPRALEINMALLLQTTGSYRARLLSCLRREVAIARKLGVPVIISSHAVNSFQLRAPRDFASLAMMFGMSDLSALNAVSVIPFGVIERNRKKLENSYVMRGVQVVRRGTNCDS